MTGAVNSKLEAIVRVRILGAGAALDVAAVIDTGFSGALTLPHHLIDQLGLRWLSIQDTELADGHVILCDVYSGAVEWDNRRLQIEIDEAETDPLLGMALLKGFELRVEVRDRGAVHVTPLP